MLVNKNVEKMSCDFVCGVPFLGEYICIRFIGQILQPIWLGLLTGSI